MSLQMILFWCMCRVLALVQVNHISHFLLTLELLPVILDSAAVTGDARIVSVSSSVHSWAVWNPEHLNDDVGYNRMQSYYHTKLYNASIY